MLIMVPPQLAGGESFGWLSTSVAEELNSGLPRTTPAETGLKPATLGFQVWRPNHSATQTSNRLSVSQHSC